MNHTQCRIAGKALAVKIMRYPYGDVRTALRVYAHERERIHAHRFFYKDNSSAFCSATEGDVLTAIMKLNDSSHNKDMAYHSLSFKMRMNIRGEKTMPRRPYHSLH